MVEIFLKRRRVEIPGPPPRLPLTVRSVEEVGRGIFAVRLDPLSMPWTPGDCVAVYAPEGGESRPYSLSSGVEDPETELLVRRIPGGRISDGLTRMQAGDRIDVSPPFGWFRPAEPAEAPKIYFATGTGIAPFLSAIRSGADMPERVYWGVRDRADLFAAEAFDRLETRVSGEGRITDLLSGVPVEPGIHYYACGLDRMIEEVSAHLKTRGVEETRIHRECFFTADHAS